MHYIPFDSIQEMYRYLDILEKKGYYQFAWGTDLYGNTIAVNTIRGVYWILNYDDPLDESDIYDIPDFK